MMSPLNILGIGQFDQLIDGMNRLQSDESARRRRAGETV
jgi:hypothetical protein